MKDADISAAKKLAVDFVAKANAVTGADDPGPRERGALKRISMELTRALADMRHPWRREKGK